MADVPDLNAAIPADALAETQLAIANYLDVLIQDANGADVYSNARALIGFLHPTKYLILPQSFNAIVLEADAPSVKLRDLGRSSGIHSFLGEQAQTYRANNSYEFPANVEQRRLWSLKITALNYISLRRAGIDSPNSFVSAALRARWCTTKVYHTTKTTNVDVTNEVTLVPDDHAELGGLCTAADVGGVIAEMGQFASEFITQSVSEAYGQRWVVKHADNLLAAVEHAFRVRGHHFKNERSERESWIDLYNRFMNACFEGNYAWPEAIEMFVIFHTAIHPFGIRALAISTAHFTAHGTIANAAIVRFSGAPVGNAVITTTLAGLVTMSGEVWYGAFAKTYGTSIDQCNAYAAQILDNKYSYHNSARLYGMEKSNEVVKGETAVSLDVAKNEVSQIAAACQGLIDALHEAAQVEAITTFALRNAKALEKAAANSPLIAARVKQLILRAVESIREAQDLARAIELALPAIAPASGAITEAGNG